ncbi:hypothetical protein SKAU_G00320300 [Synaphobranchus kaupii]|uniref:Uncharacterized protein n=1 Tax=Synaphobranchus kaupii TaxID=118154 RepID=A0A9Q1ENL5_SYNKA|nr:hypothetical protein SKAU_G00320300 [Synaphobranchus kaupii]
MLGSYRKENSMAADIHGDLPRGDKHPHKHTPNLRGRDETGERSDGVNEPERSRLQTPPPAFRYIYGSRAPRIYPRMWECRCGIILFPGLAFRHYSFTPAGILNPSGPLQSAGFTARVAQRFLDGERCRSDRWGSSFVYKTGQRFSMTHAESRRFLLNCVCSVTSQGEGRSLNLLRLNVIHSDNLHKLL